MTLLDALSKFKTELPASPNLVKFTSKLTKNETDKDKLNKELSLIQSLSSNDFIKIDGSSYRQVNYENALKIALGLKDEITEDQRFYGYGEYTDINSQLGTNIDISESVKDDTDITDLASLEAIKVDAQKNLELIDDYILGLVTGRDFKEFSLNRTNNMFIKIADTPSEKEVIEPVREYFNELYEDSEGSPNVGDLYVEPEKHRGELSTEVDNKKSVYVPKFKKV